MRNNILLPTIAVLLFAVHARAQGTHEVPRYERFADLPASAGRRLPCRRAEGDECATRIRLREEVVVAGLPFKAGSILTYWEEDLSGTLARDAEYHGVWLKGGTKVGVYFGWSGTLRGDQVIAGVPCKGDATVSFADDQLGSCVLSGPLQVGDSTLPAGTDVSLRDGNVTWATLAQSMRIDGQDFAADARLRFDEHGRVIAP